MKAFSFLSSLLCLMCAAAEAMTTPLRMKETQLLSISRRPILLSLTFLGGAVKPAASRALDMEAFANGELAKDKAPQRKLSEDESLCRFGQPSKERGEACVRAGMSTQLKKGGVDAFGRVDRGDFVRCKVFYGESNGKYVKKRQCDGGPAVIIE